MLIAKTTDHRDGLHEGDLDNLILVHANHVRRGLRGSLQQRLHRLEAL